MLTKRKGDPLFFFWSCNVFILICLQTSFHVHFTTLTLFDLLLIQKMLLKALLNARDVLIKELHNLSKGINQPIDLPDFTSALDNHGLVLTTTSNDHKEAITEVSEVSNRNHNHLEVDSWLSL